MLNKSSADVTVNEYTINNQLDYIVREIYTGHYDMVLFSVYIWNVESTNIIAKNLKKVAPHLKIFYGGPEVTFESDKFLKDHPYVDLIIRGEGERSVQKLVEVYHKDGYPTRENHDHFKSLSGITYRLDCGEIISTFDEPLIENLDMIPFPYESLEGLENRILYYESSRGCPFDCQYCLSSTIKGVRFFSLDRVKKDMKFFIDNKVMQVKFIDRTFNADKKRSLDIFKYLHERDNGYTNFHFEITADRLDEETLDFLKCVRPGLFQFEIGVQTTYEPTLKEIHRYVDFKKLQEVCRKIKTYRNIHLHLDLIAGLPYEGYDRFLESFDDVYAIRPEMLQLGFLKLLKGSGLRIRKDDYGYIYNEQPPYEIMATSALSFDEMIRLKGIEDMVEHFYNNQKFTHSLDYILKVNGIAPSKLYETLSDYWHGHGWHHKAHNQDAMYEILLDFYQSAGFKRPDLFKSVLKFDYVRQSSRRKLYSEKESVAFRQFTHAFLQDEDNIKKYLSDYQGSTAKQIVKKVRFEIFDYNVVKLIESDFNIQDIKEEKTTVLFDYDQNKSVFAVSQYYVI
tara:strand:- start:72 stop:1769 length:1698 start_codon:yes stop_codon:yes gene_type:complete